MFTIIIPSWNNLPYLKLCIESLQKNSSFQHQIVVHINEGNDGTKQWIEAQGIEHTYSDQNIGICKALNQASILAKTKYLCYFNDDMYALPGWDYFLAKDIEQIGHDLFFVSSTMIEPKPGKDLNIIQGQDFGDIQNFQEKALFKAYKDLQMPDWNGASWPPNVVALNLWEAVGGYSDEFSPGMYSDPDFAMKLWQHGVRYFKGVGESKVYHFMSKSTGKIVRNDGRKTFMQKWKITPGFFYNKMLKMGRPFKGPLPNLNKVSLAYWGSKIKAKFMA